MRTRRVTRAIHTPEPMITSVSLRDFCCLEHALKACESAWGVKLAISVVLDREPKGVFTELLKVHCIEQVHTDELNGFEGVTTGLYNPELVPYEIQMVSALLEWVCKLEEHMKS